MDNQGVDLSGLTADEEFQAGLTCEGIKASPTTPLPTPCPASEYTSNLVKIPAPNTGNNDKNPQRIQPRNLFDAAIGEDNIFKGDRYRWSLRLSGREPGKQVCALQFSVDVQRDS